MADFYESVSASSTAEAFRFYNNNTKVLTIMGNGEQSSGGQNLLFKTANSSTDNAGKTIRLNSITNTGTANDFIGFQAKPGQGTSTAKNVIGGEISPRVNDGVALTSTGTIIGLHVDTYLKGTTGNIAGDNRVLQLEQTDDTGSSRTIAGYSTFIRMRSNLSATITGIYSAIRIENEEGTKAMDGFAQFTTGTGCLVEASGTVGGTQTKALKVYIGSTVYYIPLHTAVS